MKRRKFLQGIAATTAIAATASCAKTGDEQASRAEESGTAEAQGTTEVEFLFVQNASAVSLSGGVLTLRNVAADTLWFSDRPERLTGRITTEKITDDWGTGDDNFADNPPNAVLSILQEPEPVDIVVVLGSPELVGNDLVYPVEVTDGSPEIEGAASALFIDIVGRPLSPGSVAGMSRRSGRRTARRVSRRN